MRRLVSLCVAVGIALFPIAGKAADANLDKDYVSFSLGWFDAFENDDSSALVGAEYRFRQWGYGVRPTVGVSATWDGSFYGYGGLTWDLALLVDRLYLTPSFMVGAYHDGGGKDLGGALEFRSGIELSYIMENSARVGIALQHLSNAGIYDHNPGTEVLLINYSMPVGNLF